MSSATRPEHNLLLDALPAADHARLAPYLEPVALPLGLVIFESGSKLRHLYFPTSGIVSLLYSMENGAST
jgi:hypothetical protein